MRTRLPVVLLLPVLVVLLFPIFGWLWLNGMQQEMMLTRESQLHQTTASVARTLAMNEDFVAVISDLNDNAAGFLHSTETNDLTLDGREQDWPDQIPMSFSLDNLLEIYFPYTTDSLGYELRVGNNIESLFLFFKVQDDVVVYRQLNNLSVHRNDHVQVAISTPDGSYSRYTFATIQPSDVTAHVIAPGGRALRQEPRINGRWRATDSGYNLEVAIPLDLVGSRFSATVVDVDDETTREIKYVMGAAGTGDPATLGRLILSPGPVARAVGLLPYEMVTVISRDDAVIVSSGEPPPSDQAIEGRAPISLNGQQFGTLVIRDGTADLAELVQELRIQLIIVSTLVLLLTLAAVYFIHASIRTRLGDIQAEIDSLADSRGRISALSPGEDPKDELAKFVTELAPLLNRVTQYNDYLERMASRLNHELRTPLSVVRSSLENLSQDSIPPDQGVYIERAQNGIQRLTNILNKIGEARRLEDSLDENEVVRFDLAEVVRGCVSGYESAYPEKEFELSLEVEQVPVTGIPELFAQLIDKLVDNAVEFSDGNQIRVRLTTENQSAILRVMNEGTELPPETTERLFESMVSFRNSEATSHLGLGLYVAKIIADFHGGNIRIANREDVKGVLVTVEVPLLRVTSRLR